MDQKDEGKLRRAIKNTELQYENRQMRRLGEHAVNTAIQAKKKSDCEVSRKAFDTIIKLLREAHDIDFSDPKIAWLYKLPGANVEDDKEE